MSLAVGVSLDGVRIPLSREKVAAIARAVLRAERVRDALVSVTFVSNRSIRALNRRHLRRRGMTDVIAFGLGRASASPGPVVGDVYIAADVARESARENAVPLREELTRLVVHGVLHVVGHEHPEGDGRTRSPMWRKQERLVQRLRGAAR